MAQSSFFQRFGWHIPYWVVILSLAGWIIWEKVNDRARWLDAVSSLTFEQSKSVMENCANELAFEIRNIVLEYPSPRSIDKDSCSKRYIEMSRRFQNSVEQFRESLSDTSAVREKGKGLSKNEHIEMLVREARLLQDSAHILTQNDLVLEKRIPDILFTDMNLSEGGIESIMKKARHKDLLRLLQNIQIRIEIHKVLVLFYYLETLPRINTGSPHFLPAISTDNPAPRVGEMYMADIFLNEISVRAPNIRIEVNGKEIAVKEGIAQYRRRYITSGKKSYKVSVTTNPHTKEERVYTKDFSLHVLPADSER